MREKIKNKDIHISLRKMVVVMVFALNFRLCGYEKNCVGCAILNILILK